MDNSAGRTAMIKQTRREILSTLNNMYHIGPLGFGALCSALVHLELPDDECVKRDLIYLRDKGYVEWVNEQPAYVPWSKRMYKLTARGNEIAERVDKDLALEP